MTKHPSSHRRIQSARDMKIAAMLLDRLSPAEIAQALGIEQSDVIEAQVRIGFEARLERQMAPWAVK